MTDEEQAVLNAAREFADANRALEAGERYAVTRVNRATAALHKAAWLVGQDGKTVCGACQGEGYVNIKGSEYYRTCRMCDGSGLVAKWPIEAAQRHEEYYGTTEVGS